MIFLRLSIRSKRQKIQFEIKWRFSIGGKRSNDPLWIAKWYKMGQNFEKTILGENLIKGMG